MEEIGMWTVRSNETETHLLSKTDFEFLAPLKPVDHIVFVQLLRKTKDDVARSVHTVKTSFYYAELCFCVTFFHSMYYLKPTIFHFSHK